MIFQYVPLFTFILVSTKRIDHTCRLLYATRASILFSEVKSLTNTLTDIRASVIRHMWTFALSDTYPWYPTISVIVSWRTRTSRRQTQWDLTRIFRSEVYFKSRRWLIESVVRWTGDSIDRWFCTVLSRRNSLATLQLTLQGNSIWRHSTRPYILFRARILFENVRSLEYPYLEKSNDEYHWR